MQKIPLKMPTSIVLVCLLVATAHRFYFLPGLNTVVCHTHTRIPFVQFQFIEYSVCVYAAFYRSIRPTFLWQQRIQCISPYTPYHILCATKRNSLHSNKSRQHHIFLDHILFYFSFLFCIF